MTDPLDAARRRNAAIAALQEALNNSVNEMQRELYRGLLTRLQETYEQPELLPGIFAEFNALVHLPVLQQFGEGILSLVDFNVDYHGAVGTATPAQLVSLRAPLDTWLRRQFGVATDGKLIPGQYLYTFAQDPRPLRAVQQFAYRALSSGMGLEEYRAGLEVMIQGAPATGTTPAGSGVYEQSYKEAHDVYNQADRGLQVIAAERLGLSAFLYQGGIIETSRPFCRARNNKVFLSSEIEAWSELEFSGKPEPYDPFTQCGGYNCRHQLHGLANSAAMSLRADLKEDKKGQLYISEK